MEKKILEKTLNDLGSKQKRTREKAADKLHSYASDEKDISPIFPKLLPVLKNSEPTVRYHLISAVWYSALNKIGIQIFFDILKDLLSDEDADVQSLATGALQFAAQNGQDISGAIPKLEKNLDNLDNTDDDVIQKTAKLFTYYYFTNKKLDKLEELIDKHVNTQAIHGVLWELKFIVEDNDILPLLKTILKLLEHEDFNVILEVYEVLKVISDQYKELESATQILEKHTEHKNEDMQQNSAEILSGIYNLTENYEAIKALLFNKSEMVALGAICYLKNAITKGNQLDTEIIDALLQLLGNQENDICEYDVIEDLTNFYLNKKNWDRIKKSLQMGYPISKYTAYAINMKARDEKLDIGPIVPALSLALEDKYIYEDAHKALQYAVEQDINMAKVILDIRPKLDTYDESIDPLTQQCRQILIDPNRNKYDWFEEGSQLANEERFEEALEAYYTGLYISPANGAAWNNIANIYSKEGKDIDEVLETYQKAARLYDHIPEPWINIGRIYKRKEEFEKAIQAQQKALEVAQKWVREEVFPDIYYNLACYYALNKAKNSSLEYLKKAIEVMPEFKENAQEDTDFISLQGDAAFLKLVQ